MTTLLEGQASHRMPVFLPDGRRFVFWVLGPRGIGGVYLGSLDKSDPTRLVEADGAADFAAPDQLLFFREGVLYAQTLEVESARLVGEPLPVESGFQINPTSQIRVSASRNGVVAFSTDPERSAQLAWVDRAGKPVQTIGPPVTNFFRGSLSPDGRTIAFSRDGSGTNTIWLMDVARGTLSLFAEGSGTPLWSPDGTRLVFYSIRDGFGQLYWQRIDAGGPAELLFRSDEAQNAGDWSPDGKHLMFSSQSPANARDLWSLPLESSDRTPTPFVQTAAEERSGSFSPDGRWYAYESDETGETAVFVRAFPGPGRSWRVSSGEGDRPFWRAGGGEMYYVANRQLMAVPVTMTGGAPDFGAPVALFSLSSPARTTLLRASTDGRRFLVAMDAEDVRSSPLTVIVNWARGTR